MPRGYGNRLLFPECGRGLDCFEYRRGKRKVNVSWRQLSHFLRLFRRLVRGEEEGVEEGRELDEPYS